MDTGSCVVFALAAAECLSKGSPLLISQQDIPVLRERIELALYADDLTVPAVRSSQPCPDGM